MDYSVERRRHLEFLKTVPFEGRLIPWSNRSSCYFSLRHKCSPISVLQAGTPFAGHDLDPLLVQDDLVEQWIPGFE